jgi:methionyl-tRNA formyltransferase
LTLDRVLPSLVAGSAPRLRQNLGQGSYFGGRKAEDGIIDWTRDAVSIHNLVRAVAPPYPGASATINGESMRILRSRVLDATTAPAAPSLSVHDGRLVAQCGGGGRLLVLALEVAGRDVDPAAYVESLPASARALGR